MAESIVQNALRHFLESAHGAFRSCGVFALFVARRFVADRSIQVASALTYTSLLGLVPILAIVLAMFSAFPVFNEMQERVKQMLLSPLVPEASAQARTFIDTALANTQELTTVGAVGLGATAILLLFTIESAFNEIWRVVEARPIGTRLLSFWAVLTLGPLLLGLGLSLSNFFVGVAETAGVIEIRNYIGSVSKLILFFLQAVAFTLLFLIIPHRRVQWPHALAGGVAAALLFELLRSGFALYVGSVDTYQRIYGALSAIPLFLLWLYLSWSVVLVGAEIAAALPEWRSADKATPRKALSNGVRFSAALALLHELSLSEKDGRPPDHDELVRKLPGGADRLDVASAELQRARFLICLDDGRVVLTRDLRTVSLFDLQRDLGFDLGFEIDPQYRSGGAPTWAATVSAIMRSVDANNKIRMDVSLSDLFSGGNKGEFVSDVGGKA